MRLLVIGTGSIGERHLRVFQHLDRCDAIAFCETHPARRAEIARRYGIPEAFAYADLDTALAKGTYDIAVVATPAPSHLAIGMQLADLGIHQLMEKPLSLSLDGVESYARLIAEKSLTVAVGYVHRAHPAVSAIRREIASGRFGKVLTLSISTGQSFAQMRPAYREVYFARPEMGGGARVDHHVSNTHRPRAAPHARRLPQRGGEGGSHGVNAARLRHRGGGRSAHDVGTDHRTRSVAARAP